MVKFLLLVIILSAGIQVIPGSSFAAGFEISKPVPYEESQEEKNEHQKKKVDHGDNLCFGAVFPSVIIPLPVNSRKNRLLTESYSHFANRPNTPPPNIPGIF